jgi:hypothetical protein
MTRVPLDLPPGSVVTGALRTRAEVRNLVEDMVQIELDSGVVIDVGWYPDWNPNGEYRMVVFRESFDRPIIPVFRSRDVRRVKRAIASAASRYGAPKPPIQTMAYMPIQLNPLFVGTQPARLIAASSASPRLVKVTA